MTDANQKPKIESSADLRQVIEAYHGVTERLERSHTALTDEVRRLQGQLASANAALQRSRRLAALGEMAAGIAHEVRNPLGSIQLYAGMLREDLSERPDQCELAGKISHAVRGLDAIVHDVLTFSREMRVHAVPGDVRGAFERAVEAVRPMVDAAGVEVCYRIEADEAADGAGEAGDMETGSSAPGRSSQGAGAGVMERGRLVVAHDPELMQMALINVIRNAVEAMGGGEDKDSGGRLTLAARREGEAVVLSVRDTGPGIDEEAADRIFNPFFTTRATGTGLGLAIVHRVVDAHGGSIAVGNEPGAGAVFTLTLPMRNEEADG